MLRAAQLLTRALPDISFVFVGARKNNYERVTRVAQELGLAERIQILGYVPNEHMPALYRRARSMIMPTFFGPTNLPPLEAMVVGCPMAVSNIYGMAEQCGDAALYFNPGSPEEIAQCMAQLWTDDDLCKELSTRGRARATLFTKQTFSQRLLAILDRVLLKP